MATMLLGGLWHGASWNFVIWGGLHGVYLAVHKLYLKGKKVEDHFHFTGFWSLGKFLSNVLLTYLLVLLTWLFFRATDLQTISVFIDKMIHWQSSEYTWLFLKITLVYYIVVGLFDFFEYYTKRHTFLLKIKNKAVVVGILASMFLVTLIFLFQSEPLPFVYFQF